MINNFLHTKGEIEGIKVRTYKPRQCVQYALVAAIDGFYPCSDLIKATKKMDVSQTINFEPLVQ